jgi:FkbM family methyltransferase
MKNYSLENFEWGWMNNEIRVSEGIMNHKERIIDEIFIQKAYEKHFEVKEGDVVMDIGSSIGPFTYSILHKNPKIVYCIEPSEIEHPTLIKNVSNPNVQIIKSAISNQDGKLKSKNIFGSNDEETEVDCVKFNTIIEKFKIDRIDFLKTDCEGGEYDVFNIENLCWLKKNLGVCSGEWHLNTTELKEKFREFRDVFLRVFPNHKIFSIDGVDIKWDLWNEHFIEYYTEIIISIDNR